MKREYASRVIRDALPASINVVALKRKGNYVKEKRAFRSVFGNESAVSRFKSCPLALEAQIVVELSRKNGRFR